MVDPPMPVTWCEALDGLAALVDLTNSTAPGPVVLHGLVEHAARVAGATGACFVELSEHVSRIIASSGAFQELTGCPVTISLPSASRPTRTETVWVLDPAGLGTSLQEWFLSRSTKSLAAVSAIDRGIPVGLLVLLLPAGQKALTSARQSILGLLAGYAANLYQIGRGLPALATSTQAPTARSSTADHDLFIAVTSHELRNPVTVIHGYAQTLLEHWEDLDEPAKKAAVEVVGQRGRHLAGLLDRLLQAAGEGMISPVRVSRAPFDAPAAIREAVAALPSDLRRQVRLELPDVLPQTLGDRGTIRMIVTELVTNACKYSPEHIDVTLTAGADAGTTWIRVADRGTGIRLEHVERAFQRFWQLNSADSDHRSGAGLGLYLVRRLVERQQGWVSLAAREGGGTVVEVRLPRAATNGLGEA